MKNVLITGANSGIGFALAKQLCAKGGVRVFLGARSLEKGTTAIEEIKKEFKDADIVPVVIDVANDESVNSAAKSLAESGPFYAIVNNAGVMSDDPRESINVNAYGVRRVTEAFLPLVQKPGGRIVSTGSGSASSYVSGKISGSISPEERERVLANPSVTWEELAELMQKELSASFGTADAQSYPAYGCSKAAMTAYHFIVSRNNPDLVVSTASPGFIATKMTKGMDASKTPEEGTKSLLKLLFEDLGPRAWIYYGSDCLKSPLTFMRNPGEPEFEPETEWWKK